MKDTREFIKDARKRLGDNQQQFADRIGIPLRTVHGWERNNNTHSPIGNTLLMIQEILKETGV